MSARNQDCFERLFLNLVSSRQRLDSINDLKKINFGESVPKHSLLLLYWFANTIDIDDSDNMRLTFDVNRGEYGSHRYHNFEKILDPLPPGYSYYTIGNLYQDQFRLLPKYVVNPPREYAGNNRGRIIVRVKFQNWEQGGKTIDQVYITQHHSGHQGSSYDSRHTYLITPNLIRELRLQLPHLRYGCAGLGQLISPVNEARSLPTPSSNSPVKLVIVIVLLLLLAVVLFLFHK